MAAPTLTPNITLDVSRMFFDKRVVLQMIGPKKAAAMSKGAMLTRQIAQRSMRYRKQPSTPGQPPSAHREGRGPLLRKMLYASYDPSQRSAVVGPVKLNRRDGALVTQRLEQGDRVRRRNPRRRVRVVGGGGELRIGGPACATTKQIKPWNSDKPLTVTYGPIYSPVQAERANQINEQLYGPEWITGSVRPRPYMGPALKQAAPSLPTFYAK